jgi:hypothetical protein
VGKRSFSQTCRHSSCSLKSAPIPYPFPVLCDLASGCTPTIYSLVDNIFHLVVDSGPRNPLSLHGDTAGFATQGHISRYPFGNVGDGGLMFRDYCTWYSRWDYHWRLWCAISNFPCDGLCEIPCFQITFIPYFIFVATPQISCPTYTCVDRLHTPLSPTPGHFQLSVPFYHAHFIEEKSLLVE